MSASRLGAPALALAAALAVTVGAAPAHRARAATAAAPPPLSIWKVTPTPNPVPPPLSGPGDVSNAYFQGVSAASTTEAWAVGSLELNSTEPLAEHWNGAAWKTVSVAKPAGASFFKGVDDLSPTNAWAVGSQVGQVNTLTLVEHWNGTTWSIVPSPNPQVGVGMDDTLNAIAGVGPNDLWAVGETCCAGILPLFEHWNGIRWSVVPSPTFDGAFLNGVTAIASNDVWAVGSKDGETTLAFHWNGKNWSVVPTPNLPPGTPPAGTNVLTGVSAAGSNDVWASGYEDNIPSDTYMYNKPYLLHWNGTVWNLVSVPNAGSEGSLLFGTTVLSAANIWAVGNTLETDGSLLGLTEHFNGSSWSVVPSLDPGQLGPTPDNTLSAIAAVPGQSTVWAVGTQEIPGQCCLRTLALQTSGTPPASTTSTSQSTSAAAALSFGDNSAGELGDGTATQSDAPVGVTGLKGIESISAGGRHDLALLTNGTVMAWGDNTFGQLGAGNPGPNNENSVPAAVKGLSNVTAVSSGGEHSLALLKNGTVMAWGDNVEGQLGNGTTTNSDVPVAVKGVSGAISISAGYLHSLAVLKNGTVMAWGDNIDGQLGNGTDSNISDLPAPVKGVSGATAVAAGGLHSLALLKNGTVIAWGQNESGQLGNSTETGSDTQVAVKNLSGVMAIAAGSEHSVALLTDGTVEVWGDNSFYQLAQNNNSAFGGISNSDVPVKIKGLAKVAAISAGGLFNLALLTNGTVMDWGDNALGQLGTGATTDTFTPATVPSLSHVTAVSAGAVHSLVRTG
ncbi:MAG: RCC1 domain-containing protein [Chloroflexota bacterium]